MAASGVVEPPAPPRALSGSRKCGNREYGHEQTQCQQPRHYFPFHIKCFSSLFHIGFASYNATKRYQPVKILFDSLFLQKQDVKCGECHIIYVLSYCANVYQRNACLSKTADPMTNGQLTGTVTSQVTDRGHVQICKRSRLRRFFQSPLLGIPHDLRKCKMLKPLATIHLAKQVSKKINGCFSVHFELQNLLVLSSGQKRNCGLAVSK